MALGDKMILRTADIVDLTGLSMRYWQRRLASAAMSWRAWPALENRSYSSDDLQGRAGCYSG